MYSRGGELAPRDLNTGESVAAELGEADWFLVCQRG
jgi:hypothetical protein